MKVDVSGCKTPGLDKPPYEGMTTWLAGRMACVGIPEIGASRSAALGLYFRIAQYGSIGGRAPMLPDNKEGPLLRSIERRAGMRVAAPKLGSEVFIAKLLEQLRGCADAATSMQIGQCELEARGFIFGPVLSEILAYMRARKPDTGLRVQDLANTFDSMTVDNWLHFNKARKTKFMLTDIAAARAELSKILSAYGHDADMNALSQRDLYLELESNHETQQNT